MSECKNMQRVRLVVPKLEDDERVSAHGEFDSYRVGLLYLLRERHLRKNIRQLFPLLRGQRYLRTLRTGLIAAAAATTRTRSELYRRRASTSMMMIIMQHRQRLFRTAAM